MRQGRTAWYGFRTTTSILLRSLLMLLASSTRMTPSMLSISQWTWVNSTPSSRRTASVRIVKVASTVLTWRKQQTARVLRKKHRTVAQWRTSPWHRSRLRAKTKRIYRVESIKVSLMKHKSSQLIRTNLRSRSHLRFHRSRYSRPSACCLRELLSSLRECRRSLQ